MAYFAVLLLVKFGGWLGPEIEGVKRRDELRNTVDKVRLQTLNTPKWVLDWLDLIHGARGACIPIAFWRPEYRDKILNPGWSLDDKKKMRDKWAPMAEDDVIRGLSGKMLRAVDADMIDRLVDDKMAPGWVVG